ncbi:hypothetical protein O3597_04075 [Verrucosispora sp. WMMA2044]|uniref:Uncharacterized protein n=1 Tax=Verrucosispora sioxanthis TaxID=2499994 RepID=A0A6M1LBG6_9ACTN|nr:MULTISPECIES: hypothetical protein [Micromonospora]NEE66543.1 hypothetical protein [Verrucosispora sioxanthis]NGM15653.1 hypothetical protein [Verrucosispora sioxanthis]WBB49671.1 hypothetical protein O3597_04075 [Verrucosispora sp. WMMA2044]
MSTDTTAGQPVRRPVVAAPPAPEHRASAEVSQRREFVRAFVEHAAERPASERVAVRMPTLITVTAAVAVGAVVVGVFWNLIKPMTPEQEAAAKGITVVPSVRPTVVFDAVTGWDCAAAAGRGFDARGRTAQWRTAGTGGWPQDGCKGTAVTLPQPGDEGGRPVTGQSATWWFTPGEQINSCSLSVFVPKTGSELVGAAKYAVTAGTAGTSYASFTIDQQANAGTWFDAGSYPVHQGQIAVSLDASAASGTSRARVAFGQVRVHCVS